MRVITLGRTRRAATLANRYVSSVTSSIVFQFFINPTMLVLRCLLAVLIFFFFFQAEDGIRDWSVTGVQTCALPILTGGVLFEHGHRLIAALVGLLTIGLAVWFGRSEPRAWVRRLSYLAIGAVEIGRASCRERV